MLNRSATMLLAAILPLAACSSEPEVSAENASVEEVASKVAEAGASGNFVSPGRWETKITIEDMSMPNMPPGAAEQMKSAMGPAQGATISCLTPEQVKAPKEDFFAAGETGCRFDHYKMSGGKIDAAMKCIRGEATQVMQMAGTYSDNAYNMVVSTAASGGPGGGGMKMRMRVDAKRLGACDGTEKG